MSDENVEREKAWSEFVSNNGLSYGAEQQLRVAFIGGWVRGRASRPREAKCPACGGVGEHVEGKRGFTRFPCPNAAPPVAPEACPVCYSTHRRVRNVVGEATHGVDAGEECYDEWHHEPASATAEGGGEEIVAHTPLPRGLVLWQHETGRTMVMPEAKDPCFGWRRVTMPATPASATAEGGGGDTKRAADGGTPAALSHPGLLGQSRLGSSDHTTEPLWVERDGKRVWSEGWQANRGVPYTPGMLDTLRFYAKDHFDRVQAYNDDPKRVGPEKCPESVWVMADRLLAAFPATPASAAGREGAHGPGKCLSVDAVEFDRTVASREQDERERWIREDERAKCLHAAKHSPACKGCKRVMANAIRALLASPVEGAREKFYEAARVEMDAAAAWEVESGKCSGERSAALCRALEHAHFNARSMAATCYRALLAAEAAGGGE